MGPVNILKLWLFQLVPHPRPSMVLNGRPLVKCARPERVQPPIRASTARFTPDKKAAPRPNGKATTALPTTECRTSKSEGPRFPRIFQEFMSELKSCPLYPRSASDPRSEDFPKT